MKILQIVTCLILTSCTYSVNLIHTQGSATDVVDEDLKANPNVQATATLPLDHI